MDYEKTSNEFEMISEFLEITQSAVSHQLRVLKTSGLVKIKRSGKNIYYSLADEHVGTIIDCGMEHLMGE